MFKQTNIERDLKPRRRVLMDKSSSTVGSEVGKKVSIPDGDLRQWKIIPMMDGFKCNIKLLYVYTL